MKKFLPLFSLLAFSFLTAQLSAQSFMISRRILATDTITEEGATFAVSSDDAEQENDGIDALFDDDLDAGWEGDDGDANVLTTGLRFRELGIPEGATIDSAFIVFHAHEGKSADDVANLTIVCEATDNAETFNDSTLITDRPRTTAELRWVVAEEWELWMPYRTPDLKDLVQEIVDRPGWEPGNSIAFIILGEDQGPSEFENAREFTSFENIADPEDGGDGTNKPERIPLLMVYYSLSENIVDLRVIATDTITEEGATFAVSSDDAEQENDGIDALFDDDLDAGWEGDDGDANVLTTGIRFQNIQIPQGAVIDSAFLELTTHEAKSADDVANLTIACEASDDAETFNDVDLITDRPRTDAQLRWVVAEDWELWTAYRTPDLKELVQEVVSRPGWIPGNSIAFFLLGEDQGPSEVENAREFTSFENIADPEDGGDGTNKPERVPRLLIYFSADNVTSIRQVFRNPQVETLTVFPNPARDLITIELENDGVAVIEILDMNGRMVKGLRSNFGQRQQMSVQGLPTGMYVVRARQGDKLYTQQIVVK
jgi:hypothetical protein